MKPEIWKSEVEKGLKSSTIRWEKSIYDLAQLIHCIFFEKVRVRGLHDARVNYVSGRISSGTYIHALFAHCTLVSTNP